MAGSWVRTRWAMLATGVLVGAVVGLVIFQASRLTGRNLYILVGGSAGAAAALVIHTYHRTTRLSEVKLIVPQLSEISFVVTRDSQVVAWKLFVETATRVSTQSLDVSTGLLREAMTSLHSLFEIARQTLKEAHPSRPDVGPTVEFLAVTMLNTELRPFLSKWHARLQGWEDSHPGVDESRWPEAEACREELGRLQLRVREYALGFGRLAGMVDPAATMSKADDAGR